MTMDVGLCYQTVRPANGGCEHYISDLARRLARDGHTVHLFASEADESALPPSTVYHRIPKPAGPRFRRPWVFAESVLKALAESPVDVSMGFDKTWGQDILYPQGGLHSASRAHNILKHRPGPVRTLAKWVRVLDPTSYSFARLERRQYLTPPRPVILVNSQMVRGHFRTYLGVPESEVRVLYSAIDPDRFTTDDRAAARAQERAAWGVTNETVGLFVAMNYRLKGLAPLLRSLVHVPRDREFRLVVIGSDNYKRYLALAKSLGVADRVKFLGFRRDPRNAYFGADFLVHPTFYDPGSLVALEALACGLPVITSRYNGNHELLPEPRADYVVEDPHDARDLGAKLAAMLDPERLPARKAAAAEAGRRWTFDDHYRELLTVFEEVVARKRGLPLAAR
jgi:UDP-glucose:(heptosyl)LPS alpha-1,3-glucosyltransferase